jgi:hypothetical protein
MGEEDWDLLDCVLDHADPTVISLEYGGTGRTFATPERNSPQALRRQLQRL